MNRFFASVALAAALSTQAGAEAPAETIVLIGADLHTISHGVIAGGQLLIRDGKIAALGPQVDVPAGARRIDLAGKRVYPGLIAANSILGLTEVSSVRATNDYSEAGASTPEVRAEVAVNPDTELWPVARANGVLSALVMPRAGSDGVIAGQAALMQADGWTYEQMTVAPSLGMVVAWPSARVPDWLPEERKQRIREGVQKKRDALEQAIRDARAYQAAQQAGTVSVADLRDEAMLPVIEGRMPLLVLANDAVQIREALAFAAREKLRLVLVGGSDAWRLAAALKAQDVPVILGSSHNLPLRRWEGYDAVFAAAGKLAAAGVRLAIANDGDAMSAMNERNLPYQAASYAAHGLGAEAALHAITLGPAQILGVADRLGSLDAGKEATLFVADGDILDIRSTVERAWVAGREVDLTNKQSRLYQQYQRKYRGEPKG
ncbi:amidohydrolase family protein [Dokdonella koreensis]|uniref:Amidohydrolase n=1 Tax=Dokdonella koreensis DS-123 TaxID=1300342 RepID=A0A160DWH1_9GAMM|nr:amidohydrolase family protein [Dokdonella koreensis]ANB18600.1 Amidohydrolase [Dokdonella koreensis DS-123]